MQAKIALDVYAKHTPNLIGEIQYETVAEKIWSIDELTDVWSIGHRTAAHLKRMGIHNMYELAHANPFYLKSEMGIVGTQLFAIVWGIDRSQLKERPQVKAASIGNSQVLPRDYQDQEEIEMVIKEIGEQVASRLRHHHKQAGCLSLGIGFSYAASEEDGRGGFSHSLRIDPTDSNGTIVRHLVRVFRQQWEGQTVRNVAVYTSRLQTKQGQQLTLFTLPEKQIKNANFEGIVDQIRDQFGFTALVYASSLLRGGTAINRANLVDGHNGGNAYD